ncbi:transposase [Streptomyces sp. NPDC014870]|uniref:transposase n=1 Tax=Streptomyces sp. NPDC014870 TaxID=3364925 RepID=UPI0036FCAC69
MAVPVVEASSVSSACEASAGGRHAGRPTKLDTVRPHADPSLTPRHRSGLWPGEAPRFFAGHASAHVSRVVKPARPQLQAHGITLHYLPPYSPELNRIKRVWRSVKYEGISIRAYPWIEEPQATVDQALTHRSSQLRGTATDLQKTA